MGYGEQVLTRFANRDLAHGTLQVAMDGTQKLPQRVLAVVEAVARPDLATLVLAAWAQFAPGTADDGRALPLDDPLADRVRADISTEALFGLHGVLPVTERANRLLIDDWRRRLAAHGAAEVVRYA